MPTRKISLTREQDAFVERVVKAGKYQNAGKAVGTRCARSMRAAPADEGWCRYARPRRFHRRRGYRP
jgi:hypothetical protein